MFSGIQHTEIESVWQEVLPWIEKACARMRGKMIPEDLFNYLENREMQLWIYRDPHGVAAVCVTEIVSYPRKKYCRIFIGTGRNRRDWQHHRKSIEEWAKAQKCDGMESFARKGWAEIFNDYKNTHIILEKEL